MILLISSPLKRSVLPIHCSLCTSPWGPQGHSPPPPCWSWKQILSSLSYEHCFPEVTCSPSQSCGHWPRGNCIAASVLDEIPLSVFKILHWISRHFWATSCPPCQSPRCHKSQELARPNLNSRESAAVRVELTPVSLVGWAPGYLDDCSITLLFLKSKTYI